MLKKNIKNSKKKKKNYKILFQLNNKKSEEKQKNREIEKKHFSTRTYRQVCSGRVP